MNSERDVAVYCLDDQAPIFYLNLLTICAYHVSLLAEFDQGQVCHKHLVQLYFRHCLDKLKFARWFEAKRILTDLCHFLQAKHACSVLYLLLKLFDLFVDLIVSQFWLWERYAKYLLSVFDMLVFLTFGDISLWTEGVSLHFLFQLLLESQRPLLLGLFSEWRDVRSFRILFCSHVGKSWALSCFERSHYRLKISFHIYVYNWWLATLLQVV